MTMKPQSPFFKACIDQDLLRLTSRIQRPDHILQRHHQPPTNSYKMEVKTANPTETRSGCGGAVYNEEGNWTWGFCCKLRKVPPDIAELIGIIHGLYSCWEKGIRHIAITTSSVNLLNWITRGCDIRHPFKDLIQEARALIHKQWQVTAHLLPWDQNSHACNLASHSLSIQGNFCIIDQPPTTPHGLDGD